MLDLPDHSVLVAGLDYWSPGGEEIHEPRLVEKLKLILDVTTLKLQTPPPDPDDPSAPQTGITGWQFPEWFITQDVDVLDPTSTVRFAHAGAANRTDEGQIHRRREEEAARGAGAFRQGVPRRPHRGHRVAELRSRRADGLPSTALDGRARYKRRSGGSVDSLRVQGRSATWARRH